MDQTLLMQREDGGDREPAVVPTAELGALPHEHERGVSPPAKGVLRNVSGVLFQQGRVTTDADLTEGELLDLAWNGQAGRDIIGAGVCAVPAQEPSHGCAVQSASVPAHCISMSSGWAPMARMFMIVPGECADRCERRAGRSAG